MGNILLSFLHKLPKVIHDFSQLYTWISHSDDPSEKHELMLTNGLIPTSVNYHFTRRCNYKCGFCFHTAKTSFVLPLEEAMKGLKMLKEAGEIPCSRHFWIKIIIYDLLPIISLRLDLLAQVLTTPSNARMSPYLQMLVSLLKTQESRESSKVISFC